MSAATGPFSRRIALWLPPAIVLAVASILLVRHLGGGDGEGGTLDRRFQAAVAERDSTRAEEARLAGLARAEETNRVEVEQLYREHFSTESGRFTDLVREIRRLAEHAGLDPKEFGYPEEKFDGFDLSRRSFVFDVEGSYANLRTFLHLLELSPSFVTVDEIRVSERKGTGVSIRLRLSTLFVAPDAAPDRTNAS
jgi:hypothetical protein